MRSALGGLMLVACVPSHVAAIAVEGTGGASGVSLSEEGDAGSDGTATCSLPSPTPGCDAFADPLRAAEFSCYEGISAATFSSNDASAWRRAHEFGNAFWTADDSDAILVLSTGALPEPNAAEQVVVEPGAAQLASVDNGNPDGAMLPPPIDPTPGAGAQAYSECDGVGDCSETLSDQWANGGLAQDLIWLSFDADVPADAHGYSLRVGMLSAEYPERIGAAANDTFVWWASSETFTGNLATLAGAPANVTGLSGLMAAYRLDHPMLLRTGFDGGTGSPCTVDGVELADCPLGAATGWLQLRGPAQPGERISIAAALFDQGDALIDTVAVLDQWRWTCSGCTPGDSCGLQAP